MKKIELITIQNGAVMDLFDEEFRKVLANIQDENTVSNAERSVTIKITVKPDKTRRTGEVKTQVSCTLAKVKPAESFLFFDRDDDGEFTAYADDPGPLLPGMEEDKSDGKTVSFPKVSNGS
jgi:hypothetical protein